MLLWLEVLLSLCGDNNTSLHPRMPKKKGVHAKFEIQFGNTVYKLYVFEKIMYKVITIRG